MGNADIEFRIAEGYTMAQCRAVLAQIELGQPCLAGEGTGAYLGVAKVGELLVDAYGILDEDGYTVWTATVRCTQIDLESVLSEKQFEELDAYANKHFPTIRQRQKAARSNSDHVIGVPA